MNLLIAIPSKGRANTITRNSMSYADKLGYDCRVFVEPQDYTAYAAAIHPNLLVTLDDNDKGLGYAKSAIAQYARQHGYDAIFKLDDDVEYWSPGHSTPAENRATTPDTLRTAIALTCERFKENAIKAVGFNYKMFMHIKHSRVWAFNRTLQSCYIVKTNAIAARSDIGCFEDRYTALSIWVNGGLTLQYNRAGMFMRGKKYIGLSEGGMQDFDRAALALQALEALRKLYPPLKIKRVDRPWKYEPDMVAAARELNKRHVIEREA